MPKTSVNPALFEKLYTFLRTETASPTDALKAVTAMALLICDDNENIEPGLVIESQSPTHILSIVRL